MIKLAICDDDALIRESLKIILSMDKELNVVFTGSNGVELCNFLESSEKVDVVLLDVRMPEMNGVEATKLIAHKTRVIILTTFDEDDYIKEAMANGAKGYILKNNTPDRIIDTIKMVYKGANVVENSVFDKFKQNINVGIEIDNKKFTDREIEIIKCIGEGLSNKEISSKLFISEGTVKNYITNILCKTNLEHRTQIAIAYLTGKLK